MIDQVKLFLASERTRGHRAHLYTKSMMLYCRIGRRYIEGNPVITFDIADILVEPRSSGILTSFLDELEVLPDLSCIYIENIMDKRLLIYFVERRHYSPVPLPGSLFELPASVYKILKPQSNRDAT